MAEIMSAAEFVSKCRSVAQNVKTVYGKGMCGCPVDKYNIDRMAKIYPDWYKSHKSELSERIGENYFGFDCVCFVKSILWGWNGDPSKTLGGAVYLSNGVGDVTVSGMRRYCYELSSDFSINSIAPGELLFKSDHVGVYLGDGVCAEATLNSSRTRNGVILSFVDNMKALENKGALYRRSWDEHGKLQFIDYSSAGTEDEDALVLPFLKKGDKLPSVRSLQALLDGLGFRGRNDLPLALDASFGADTRFALEAFQRTSGIPVTSVTDIPTWKALLAL